MLQWSPSKPILHIKVWNKLKRKPCGLHHLPVFMKTKCKSFICFTVFKRVFASLVCLKIHLFPFADFIKWKPSSNLTLQNTLIKFLKYCSSWIGKRQGTMKKSLIANQTVKIQRTQEHQHCFLLLNCNTFPIPSEIFQ